MCETATSKVTHLCFWPSLRNESFALPCHDVLSLGSSMLPLTICDTHLARWIHLGLSMHFVDDNIFEFGERQVSLIHTIEIHHRCFFLKAFDDHETRWFSCKARNIRGYYKLD